MGDARDSFVGRVETVKTLKSWLTGEVAKGKLSIGSIAGSAGIGKTYLLEHALRECNLERRRYATLRFNGAQPISTLASAVQALVHGVKNHAGKPMRFPQSDECRRALEWMDIRARKEIEDAVKSNADLAKTVADVFAVCVGLAELVPIPQVQATARIARMVPKKHVESVVRLIQKAAAYQSEKPPRILNRKDVRLRNDLRNDLAATLFAALVTDLQDGLREPLLSSETKRGRLLLIIDDYEHTGDVLGDALLRCLAPRLKDVEFETLMIVIGRDRLKDTAPGWAQHHQDALLAPIVLEELGQGEAEQYIRLRGIENAATIERIVRDTAGYPYLLAAEVDDELEGGSSALSRKNFFDRTTQWMTAEQKDWSKRLAFLDEISLETIPRVISDVDRSETIRIMEWFKSEASLRSPTAARWSLRPMIRTKLREYVRNDSEALFGELTRAAAGGRTSSESSVS